MKVSSMEAGLEELRTLHKTLVNRRIHHNNLVSRMQFLRQQCRELRTQLAAASKSGSFEFSVDAREFEADKFGSST